ncbi:hypothetical protein ACS3UN_09120 [Oscillospiraceae bacterium LTW-04]|nr:hypothetical protein RBH76_10880 [Oscillospiraceae bacterium MB24-C1]
MKAVYYYPASAMRVCVDRLSGTEISGRAYCPQLEEPIVFKDLSMFLLMADRALDRRGYPLAFQKKRSFLEERMVDGAESLYKEVKPIRQHEQVIDVSAMRGEICTFLVHVLSRRNCSWQGRIDWIDDGDFDTFNSGLVFLRRVGARLVQLSPGNMKSPKYQ